MTGFRRAPRHAIGIDIGGTNIRAGLVDEGGTILAQTLLPSHPDPETVLRRCLSLIADLRGPEVAAIGIGIPGQVNAATRMALSGGYVDLSPLPFAALVERAAGLPVAVENDAAMALLAEAAFGAAKGQPDAVMLTIGTGIGGAVLEGGQLLRGQATAGQLGHVVVQIDGPHCVCGRQGCVETLSSGTAFARHLTDAGLPPHTRAEDLLTRTDTVAQGVIARWARPLRAALDSLITICNPGVVVIGGGAGGAMVKALDRFPPARSWFDAPVLAATLGDDAGVIGAALAGLRALPAPRVKRLVMVNGVPASGKSGVASALAGATGWPLLTLDTVKGPFLQELAPVDRPVNRTLGRASLNAMFDILAEASGGTFLMDAWFGFQPRDVVEAGLARAGLWGVAEVWCDAPPDLVGARYAARVAMRGPGHPGLEYVPELVALAARAEPLALGPVLRVATDGPVDTGAILTWLDSGIWQNSAPPP
ncbi:MAG: ROK family protein [Rubellimicrobium sp.]|nr:ROK family protein [Rubellimicrobium sp.]